MRSFVLLPSVIVCLVFASGCRMMPGAAGGGAAVARPAPVSRVGESVKKLVAAAERRGCRVEYFAADGEAAEKLAADAGSVSIHQADGSGQDNYAYGADGLVMVHKRSYGEDYARGVWEEVR